MSDYDSLTLSGLPGGDIEVNPEAESYVAEDHGAGSGASKGLIASFGLPSARAS